MSGKAQGGIFVAPDVGELVEDVPPSPATGEAELVVSSIDGEAVIVSPAAGEVVAVSPCAGGDVVAPLVDATVGTLVMTATVGVGGHVSNSVGLVIGASVVDSIGPVVGALLSSLSDGADEASAFEGVGGLVTGSVSAMVGAPLATPVSVEGVGGLVTDSVSTTVELVVGALVSGDDTGADDTGAEVSGAGGLVFVNGGAVSPGQNKVCGGIF